jgi:uncharacterized protein YejL (UPF0352 family)
MSSRETEQFIKPIKLTQILKNSAPERALNDLTNQIENIFGTNIPVRHRVNLAESVARSLDFSIKSEHLDKQRGKHYDQRISNLENEIVYLKSLIEESKYKSRQGSPVRS